MKRRLLGIIPPGALAVAAAVVLLLWIRTGPSDGMALRVPGLDREGTSDRRETLATPEPGEPAAFDGKPSELAGAWPWFRGPNRDGICDDGVRLARKWPEGGPEVLWTLDLLGPGHAGAAISGGCVYLLDYDEEARADTMRCLSLDDGREIWRNGYPVIVPDDHGMSRTVPAVVDGHVISMGPKCHVACWDARTGQCRWLLDLMVQYGARFPPWYTGQCPLIDQGRLILAPSGDAFLIAVDYTSGKVIWESPKLHNWTMTHVSIATMEFGEHRMYVYCGSGGVAGISAADGSVLWETDAWVGKMATCPTPVPVGDGRIFLTSGYHEATDAASLMIQLKQKDGRLVVETLFELTRRQFESEQHTPILYGGHLYGARTKYSGDQFACIDLEGKEVWNSGRDKVGRGPYLIADGLIYMLADDATLIMAEATSDGYRPLGRFEVFKDGRDAWAPMALAGGRLVLRDLRRMACLELGVGSGE